MGLVVSDRNMGYFPSYIKQRIERNKNFVCCITGQTGSGKSWSAMRLGEILDPNFDIRNVVFEPVEFMQLVNGKSKKLKRGSCIIYDEIQVSMGHLDFQSLQSKMLNYVLQTFRHRNFILFMTSPHFNFINSSARKLFHSRMETVSIDKKKKTVNLKPFLLQVSQDKGKVYRKYLRVATKEYGVTPVKRIRVSLPSQDLINEYERKKTAFTNKLNESIEKDLKKLESDDKPKLTKIQEGTVIALKSGLTIPQIAQERGVSERLIYSEIKYIEKKGIEIIPIKEGNIVKYYEVKGY